MGLLLTKPLLSRTQQSRLLSLSLQGFGGGLNAVDDEWNMQPKYSVVLNNMRRTPAGGQQVRYGNKWFADIKSNVTGTIVDMTYFNSTIIAVTSTGQIASIGGNGVVVTIWNSAIAAALPGSPAGWGGSFVAVSFVPFKDGLIIHNGVDKPLNIDKNNHVTYLQDLATGSNVNTPIGKYGCVAQNYHCIAGIAGQPTTIYISAVGTSGVFPGDTAPNDSISIDVGAYSPLGAIAIRGLAGFRSYLLVFFQGQTLIVQLGNYDASGVHKPVFPDTMPKFGLLGHRCIVGIERDLQFTGLDGYSDAQRNLFSGAIVSAHMSDHIEPIYRNLTGNLSDGQQQNNCFLTHDPLWRDVMLFLPTGQVLVYTSNPNLHYSSWSQYTFPNTWVAACTSFLGRVFYAMGTKIFQQGNAVFTGENYTMDHVNDRDFNWAVGVAYLAGQLVADPMTNIAYMCMMNHVAGGANMAADIAANPGVWSQYYGMPITFTMELPWLSGKDSMKVKQLRFSQVTALGTAEYTMNLYVDGMYKNSQGVAVFPPALSMDFIGDDTHGAGYNDGPMGGGRRGADPRLWGTPLKFKHLKVQLTGSASAPLQFTNMSFLYSRGRYKR